jgi:hypothetical protein
MKVDGNLKTMLNVNNKCIPLYLLINKTPFILSLKGAKVTVGNKPKEAMLDDYKRFTRARLNNVVLV